MEDSVKSREFILREVAPTVFLNDIISNKEWHVAINDTVTRITVDGVASDDIEYNDLLRTLIWGNLKAEGTQVKSIALSFDRDLVSCHGKITLASGPSFLVESVSKFGNTSDSLTFQNTELSAPPAYYAGDSPEAQKVRDERIESNKANDTQFFQVEDGQTQLKQMALDVIKQASYEVAMDPLHSKMMANLTATPAGLSQTAADMNLSVEDPGKALLDDVSILETVSTSDAQLVVYTTRRRPKGSTNEKAWEFFAPFGVGSERQTMLHQLIYIGDTDITNFVVASGDHYTKEANIAFHPDQCGFDIMFTGEGHAKTFTGTLTKDGQEFEWKGGSPNIQIVQREGDNKPVVGTDGLKLDALLYGVSSLAREEDGNKSIDLAQKEADQTLGRLMMGSVDTDISDMLFKDVFTLTEAEKEIQKKGLEFLKRAGIHHVLKTIKTAEKVKASIKNKINLDKCDRFIPMCLAPVAPAEVTNDPVFLYGLDRTKEKDKPLINQLQNEAREVQQACYVAGYRTACLGIQPYLKNAGEWYNILDTTLCDKIFIQDWTNKASASEGVSKTMYNLKTILDVLWQVTQEKDEFKQKLKSGIKTPEELHAVLNGAAYGKALEVLAWDDTLRAKVKEVFSKLDQVEKEKREAELAEKLKTQMIVDSKKQGSFQALGEVLMSFMEQLRGNSTWTARDAQDALALAHAGDAGEGVGAVTEKLAARAKAEKKIQVKERWFSGARALVTAASFGLLTWVLSNKTASMEWYETLAVAGELCQGFATLHAELSALGRSLKSSYQKGIGSLSAKALKVKTFFADMARWVYRYVFAPVGRVAVTIGTWLYNAVGRIGKALITGIRSFASMVASGIKAGLIATYEKTIGRAVIFLKSLPIAWGNVFNVICKVLSFGISALCLGIAIRDCITAWRSGRTVDIVTSTIGAVLVGLEVLCLVIQGIAWLVDAGAIVAACSTIGMALGVLGIIFAVVLIIVAFATYEDPLDALVEKYGRKYSLLY